MGRAVPAEEYLDGRFFLQGDRSDELMKVGEDQVKAVPRVRLAAARRPGAGSFRVPFKREGGPNKVERLRKPLHNPYRPKAVVVYQPLPGTSGKIPVCQSALFVLRS
jgi:hypothetical protein